jgi:hypothetical protein
VKTPRPEPQRHYRKIIRITGAMSPNVLYAENEIAKGFEVSHFEVVPGVLSYREYRKRLDTWPEERVCVAIHARFWKGKSTLLYPPAWLNRAAKVAAELARSGKRGTRDVHPPVGIGVDPAEGGDDCVWTVADARGLLAQQAEKTPDTGVIVPKTLALMRRWSVPPDRVVFDRGGGGKQHADAMERDGHWGVRTVGFGESPAPDPAPGFVDFGVRTDRKEERYAYTKNRDMLYGEFRNLLDPGLHPQGYGVPDAPEFAELLRQLAPLPLTFDAEGRLKLIPKRHPPGADRKKQPSIVQILGCSPDEADSAVLAVHAVLHEGVESTAGGF